MESPEVSERFKYYSHYSSYRMNTTIQLSKETKELISTFGSKEDTYDDIIRRMYKLAVKEQVTEFLMSSEGTIPIDEAIKRAKKRWQK
jgi:hypothetical protein